MADVSLNLAANRQYNNLERGRTMNTSRADGILVVPVSEYEASVGGQFVKCKTIIMKEMKSELADDAASDLEQLTKTAIMKLTKEFQGQERPAVEDDDDDEYDFYNDNSPSEEEVEKQVDQLSAMIFMQDGVKASKFLAVFKTINSEGLIRIEGDYRMQETVWKNMKRQDRIKLMIAYIAFFVQPLQSVQKQNTTKKVRSSTAGATKG